MKSIHFVVIVIALLFNNFGYCFLVKGMNHRNDFILSLLSKEQNGMSKDHSNDKNVATNLTSSNQITTDSSNKNSTFKRFEKDNKKSLRLLVNGLSQLKRKDF
mmetsp:Transcript_17314/g.15612  ORF Transcript_17314/g.15612 Transcript_17314/m.15612 type:complete len:103 (+) Transcript_17314:95-403(+)